MQDYKSLCAAVTICATLVNIQTDRQHNFDQLKIILNTGQQLQTIQVTTENISVWYQADHGILQLFVYFQLNPLNGRGVNWLHFATQV